MNKLVDFLDTLKSDLYVEPDNMTGFIDSGIDSIIGRIKKDSRILDVGCGQGYALEVFKKLEANPVGITLNEEEVEIVKEKGLDVRLMDMSVLDFENNEFDIVWARHSLEHSIFPLYTLAQWHRVLKPEGLLYIEVPAPDTDNNHEFNKNHYSVLGKRMWLSLLQKAGFKILGTFDIELICENGNKDLYYRIWTEK